MFSRDNLGGGPIVRNGSTLKNITWQDLVSKYPLSQALSKNNSTSTSRSLLNDDGAAKLIFVKRPTGRSFICTINPDVETVSNYHIPDEIRPSIDSALDQYIESMLSTTHESSLEHLSSYRTKKIDLNTFIKGDLVVLKANVLHSSKCKQGPAVTLEASEACLGDQSWGRMGVVQSMRTKAGEQIIRVRELLHDSICAYSESDLQFADGSSLDENGTDFTLPKLFDSDPSPRSTYAVAGATIPLSSSDITVDTTEGSYSKDNMLNEDMTSYWQSDLVVGTRPWIQVTLPPGAGKVFPELQLYTTDNNNFSPNNISISTGANSSSLVKLKDMTLTTSPQWNTLVTSDEFKKAAATAKSPVRVVRISITDNHFGGGESRVCGVRLVNTSVPEFHRQLSVGERVVLSSSFSENQDDGWCLGKISDAKTGVVVCVPDTSSKFTEQRDIVVLSDDDNEASRLSVFRASWLERSPPPTDLIPGQLVQLNPATWKDGKNTTDIKCLGRLEQRKFGIVLSTGSLCKGILRNVEVALVDPSSLSSSNQSEVQSTSPLVSLYPSTSIMLVHPCMIMTEESKALLKGLLRDCFPATEGIMNIDSVLERTGIEIFSLLSSRRGVSFVISKIRTWISQMNTENLDTRKYLIPSVFFDAKSISDKEELNDSVSTAEFEQISWTCKRNNCGYVDNPMHLSACTMCKKKGELWTCLTCQKLNKVNASVCTGCSSKKKTKNETTAADVPISTDVVISPAMTTSTAVDLWSCMICRQLNVAEELICKLCCVRKPYGESFQPFPSIRSNITNVESPHPYANNADTYTTVEVPGATEVLVYFDKQSATEKGHDYVKLYKDGSHSSYWGEEKYTGRVGDRNFPGTENRPPLRIPSNSFVVHFHSDGSSVDWGYKILAIAAPPEVIPTLPNGQLSSESKVVESSHPYSDNTDEYTVVEIPGATGYSISFDPQSCTENSYDYVRFYKDDTHTERWGEEKYSGGSSNKNFPGCEGRPPLEIPAGRFVVYFHSDGSNSNWGFKLTASKMTSDVPSVLSVTSDVPSVLSVGDKVVRGKDWQWGDQDGGEGKTGVVKELLDSNGWINISWDANGKSNKYRYGSDKCYDVKAVVHNDTTTTTSTTAAIATTTTDVASGVHTGMMQCKCIHDAGRLTFPLDKDMVHLYCQWECCKANWDVSVCTASSTVPSARGEVPSVLNSDMARSVATEFKPCCSNHHPMTKLTKAEFALLLKKSLKNEGDDEEDDDDDGDIIGILELSCNICGKYDIQDESHFYHCHDCSYDMCESCVATVSQSQPSDVLPVCSVSHTMKKILHGQYPERYGSSMGVLCDVCNRKPLGNDPFFFHCKDCEYDLCTSCASASCPSQEILGRVKKSGDSHIVESSHPYKNNVNSYIVVEIPGEIGCVLQFDPLCSTESAHDFIRIYKDDKHKDYWGEEKYTGGFLGTSKNFPGVDNTLPLLIPSNRFVIHFRSDGSNVDWGYKIKITARTKRDTMLTPETFVDIPEEKKLLAWNLYLEAIKRVDNTATVSLPQHTETDVESDDDSDVELDDSDRTDTELVLNNSDEFAITSAAPKLSAVSRRASSIRMKSIDDYEPIDSIRSLLAVKDRDNNTVLHHTALMGLHSSYNKLLTCGASPWLVNSKGQTAAGLEAGVKGHPSRFQLHRACLRHEFLDKDLTSAALRCPVEYDLPPELLHVWTLINDRRAEDAIAYACSLEQNNKISVSDHHQIFVTLATFLADYGEKTTLMELSAYENHVKTRLNDNSFYLHPVYFYVHYRLCMQNPPKGKIARNRAADALSAFKCFHKLSDRFLFAIDNIDDIVEAEAKDQDKFDEDSDDDEELEEDLPPDAPEIEWLEVKKQLGKTSPSMDKLMALTGLKEVKKKAMAVYKEVLLAPFRPDDLENRTTMNFLFIGNPGTGKTTVSELLAAAMVEIGFRSNPVPFLTNAGDILKAKDPAGEFETLVNNAIGGTVFIDEAYLFKPAPRGQTANASNAVLDYLLKVAEEKRETTTFILAGYKDDIEGLLIYNEGFTSRFPKQFTFPFEDYNELQLRRILKSMVRGRGFVFASKKVCGVNLPKVLSRRIARGIGVKGFGNAREVRNRIDQCIGRQTARLGSLVLRKDAESAKLSKEDMMIRTLTVSDTIGDRPDFTNSVTLKELDDMIGLVAVKSAIRGLMELQLHNYNREVRGEKIEQISLHRVFFGNPGTGKTTVARIYGNLLKEFGFLSDGSVIQVTGSDLIGDAVGVSSTKTAEILAKAKGKVLFIDEAYVLDPTRRGNSYGGNALDTLVEKIQANEGSDMAVILAGYESEMRDLFRNCGNAGLSRRFNLSEAIRFEDFSDDELKSILKGSVKRAGLAIRADTATEVVRIVARGRRLDGFGNAGAVETILGRAKLNKSKRLAAAATERRQTPVEERKPLPHPDLLLLEDFVTEELSVAKARAQFDVLSNCAHILQFIEKLDATILLVRSEGKSPADLVPSSHMIFTGPPGTGKSTVVRKFGAVLYNLEILPRDTVTFTTGKSMQAGHVGGTPLMVTELMGKAKGGLLVIDEAYGLYPERGNYGEEAIQTLLDNMSKPEFQGNLVVILVDQVDRIESLLQFNQALRSQFDKKRIVFPAWTGRQATVAALAVISKDSKTITDEASEALFQRFSKLERLPGWSSARDVYENIVPQLYAARADRLLRSDDDKNNTTAPYELADVDMACKSFITNRMASQKARDKVVKAKGQPPGPDDEYRYEVDHPETFRPVIKENFTHVENKIGGSSGGNASGSDEDIWAALEEACQELGYDLQQMEDMFESKNFPPELMDLMRLKTKKSPEAVRTMLIPQCGRLLQQVRMIRAQMAAAKSQEEHVKQEKLRKLGRCPMHFEWLKVEGGYQCAGGSHFCSDNEIESISVNV